MKHFTLIITIFSSAIVSAQTISFKSDQTFSKEQMNGFYSSLSISEDLVLFNANDYKLYAYHKDGSPAWTAAINRKSDIPPFFVGNTVWVTGYTDRQTEVQILNLADGTLKHKPGLEIIHTKPMIRNGVLYSTGISNLGCVFAYDMKKDSILWERFLAHGCSREPYYPAEKIIANAEGDNWLQIDYNGRLLDPSCEDSTVRFPSELKCIKKFDALTHDGFEISGKRKERWLGEEGIIGYSSNHTFFLQPEKLIVVGKKAREKSEIDIKQWFEDKAIDEYAIKAIAKADDVRIWLLINHHFVLYNHREVKRENMIDLSEWEPHQIMPDGNKLWMISKKDGLLYSVNQEQASQ